MDVLAFSLPVEPSTLAVLVSGALIGGVISGALGFGSGPAVIGIWLLVLPPQVAAPLLTFNALFFVSASIRQVWHAVDIGRLTPLVIGSLLGTPLGVTVLLLIPGDALKLAIGTLLIGYAAIMLTVGRALVIQKTTVLIETLVGLAGGAIGGAAAMPGVIWAFWCGIRGWSKDVQRAVYQPLNLMTVAFAVISFAVAGLVTRDVLWLALLTLPASLGGVALGMPLYARIDTGLFRRVVLVALGLIGVSIVVGRLLEAS
ncbi:MAG: sulfite exporter TauE/SafE family protein [Pseudomonadota bacterium]